MSLISWPERRRREELREREHAAKNDRLNGAPRDAQFHGKGRYYKVGRFDKTFVWVNGEWRATNVDITVFGFREVMHG